MRFDLLLPTRVHPDEMHQGKNVRLHLCLVTLSVALALRREPGAVIEEENLILVNAVHCHALLSLSTLINY